MFLKEQGGISRPHSHSAYLRGDGVHITWDICEFLEWLANQPQSTKIEKLALRPSE